MNALSLTLLRTKPRRMGISLILLAGFLAAEPFASMAVAQTRIRQMTPARRSQPATQQPPTARSSTPPPPIIPPGAATTGSAKSSVFSEQELERIKQAYEAASDDEKKEMVSFYRSMEVDLLAELGLTSASAATAPQKKIPDTIRVLDFARTPEAVLAARSKLGFSAQVMPDLSKAEPLAEWIHMHVLAGEWQVFADVLKLLPEDDATAVYSHILRSTQKSTEGLLPEEVLALGDACPANLVQWQLDILAQLLKKSAAKYGTAQFLSKIKEGTNHFGPQDDERRVRTVRLFVGAGLATEAYQYLPPLEEAQASGNARIIYSHARYYQDLVASGRSGASEDSYLAKAWQLFGDVTLMDDADEDLRKDAMTRAIELLTRVPPARATTWLAAVFANEALGPAALEVVALQALKVRDKKVKPAQRAEGLATMKAAVDTLLDQEELDLARLRIPMRMLTSALANEVEAVVKEKAPFRGVPAETSLLYRATPSERWLAAIEPSVAIRGYRAAIAIATIADETDAALHVLTNAVNRFPDSGVDFADDFLSLWEKRLNPKQKRQQINNPFYFQRRRMPAAPLTRGRQRRNLDRLEMLISLLDEKGIKSRTLPSVSRVFKACHAKTEIFERKQIERVFGSFVQIPAETTSMLAESMRVGLGGDWRDRRLQRSYGVRRSKAEIGDMVEAGYELAIELANLARDSEPDSWKHAILHAALNYDRMQFKQTQDKADFATYNEYRRQAFSAFEQASFQYADLVKQGLERDSSGVYMKWFAAVLDVADPAEDEQQSVPAGNDDQFKRIGDAMKQLPDDAYDRHVSNFAREVVNSLRGVPPEKKPTVVKSAQLIVGDHPAGAPLREMHELYVDLLRDEIRLRILVDGDDRVSHGELFGALLTLRYTNSVDRETGGFDKYLQQDIYMQMGNAFRMMNYRRELKSSIEKSLSSNFNIESIGLFEALTPSRAVLEESESGWQEKPMAYILMSAKDASIDRIEPISFDMHFEDQSGQVTLAAVSNSPPIDASGEAQSRPCKGIQVDMIVDTRRLESQSDDREVTLEIHAKARGVIPEIDSLLDGLDTALPGYELDRESIESRTQNVIEIDQPTFQYYGGVPDDDKEFEEADDDGIWRLQTERSWLATYRPTAETAGDRFTIPTLHASINGKLIARQYADMDIIEVESGWIALSPTWSTTSKLSVALAIIAATALGFWIRSRRGKSGQDEIAEFPLPARITPLSTISMLEWIRSDSETRLSAQQLGALANDISRVEQEHFAPNGKSNINESDLRDLLERWREAAWH